jgi:isopenicillin N synthase-like dioxygenase
MQVEGWLMVCHYCPPCPEPARVVGSLEHTDPSLFTLLAQDRVGGLQVRRDDGTGGGEEWVDVASVAGALLVNIGDVLKVTHRVRVAVNKTWKGTLDYIIFASNNYARYK